MKAVIFAGGLGTRISEETSTRPKPMVEVGGKPILWHILKMYSAHGVNDFVIATGVQYSVRQFIEWSAAELGVTLKFEGQGVDEIATVTSIVGDNAPGLKVGDLIVRIDLRYFRPTEVETLLGDPTKAKEKLGWVPEITVQEMCAEMVASDLAQAKQHALLKKHGYSVNVSVE